MNNNKQDSFFLRTGFGKMIVSKLVTKAIRETLKRDVDIAIGDTDCYYEDGNLNISIKNLVIEMDGNSIIELLKL